MTLKEEMLKNSGLINEIYYSVPKKSITFKVSNYTMMRIQDAYDERKDDDLGRGINWVMEEIFGENWQKISS